MLQAQQPFGMIPVQLPCQTADLCQTGAQLPEIWAPLSGGAVAPPLLRLAPIYQEPNTSKKHPQHKIWPYLLRNMVIDREL